MKKIIAWVDNRGFSISKSKFEKKCGSISKLTNKLTITKSSHIKNIRPKEVHAFKWEDANGNDLRPKGEYLRLPICKLEYFMNNKITDNIKWAGGEKLSEPRIVSNYNCHINQPLYDYQEVAVNYICENRFSNESVKNKKSQAYLEMDTGLGKTRTAGGCIAKMKVPTLIVVPTEAIREQVMDELNAMMPNLIIGKYIAAKKNKPGPETHDVVIIIVNTLRKQNISFLSGYGMLIIDEAHEYSSPSSINVLWLAQTKYVLGLSASPEEEENPLSGIVKFFLGNVIYSEDIPGFDIGDVNFDGVVKEISYSGHPNYITDIYNNSGVFSSMETIGLIINDPYRLKIIVEETFWLYNLHNTKYAKEYGLGNGKEHVIIIFAEHRKFLSVIGNALCKKFSPDEIEIPEIGDKPNDNEEIKFKEKMQILMGGSGKNAVKKANDRRIIVTTFAYSRRGVSIKNATAAIYATSRRGGFKQITGRNLRRGSDESILRIYIDIKDVETRLKKQSEGRMKIYKRRGFSLYKFKKSYKDYQSNTNKHIDMKLRERDKAINRRWSPLENNHEVSSSDEKMVSSSDENMVSSSDEKMVSSSDENMVSGIGENVVSSSDENIVSSSDENMVLDSDELELLL